MIRNWSVLRWPVVLAAMSDSTTSARPSSIASSFSRRVVVEKIELREVDARDLRHLEKIDRNHLALAVRGADPLGRDLAPAAGRGAEIDHRHAGLEKVVLVVDLDQLVGGARAQPVPPGRAT